MDVHLKILEALANGVDPVTGETLPDRSPYNQPAVIRALFAALTRIKVPVSVQPGVKKTLEQRQSDNLDRGLPRNAGLPWSAEQRRDLGERFKSGKSIGTLAVEHERTRSAIRSELKRQDLIDD